VEYVIENNDNIAHRVGLRVMLDTFIGGKDGVPFQIPGEQELLETKKRYGGDKVPDFLRAQESPDVEDPGTVAQMGFMLKEREPPEELLICRWPGNKEVRWSWDPKAINDAPNENKDSCVALYWAYKAMMPGESRRVGFTYGLGPVAACAGGLGLAAQGPTRPGGVFTVAAYVQKPEPGQQLEIHLPGELKLSDGETEKKTLAVAESGKGALVTWRVQAQRKGEYLVEVTSGTLKGEFQVLIHKDSMFH
jgi:hypothetical protein